jgi:PAS domain S-box-containing protein
MLLATGSFVCCAMALLWGLRLRRRLAGAQTRGVQDLVENAADFVLTLDAEGRILFANRAVAEFSRHPNEEFIGAPVSRLLPEITPARWAKWMARAKTSGVRTLRAERDLTTRNGGTVTVEFSLRITREPLRVEAIGRDVTVRVRRQARVEKAWRRAEEGSRNKGDFLANMSHEIRTPMNGVRGMTELLLDTPLDLRQRNMVSTIRESAEALLRVVNDVLDFSKLEAEMVEIVPHPLNLCRAMEEVLDLMGFAAREKQLELVFDYCFDLPFHFYADGGRLRQMVLNLLSNAVKFTEHGYVRLAISVDRQVTPAMVTVTVEDSGVGIAPAQQALLFRKFQQVDLAASRKHGGSGLGLAITRRLVDLMGGAMKVESTEGVGSQFSFTIPLEIDQAAERQRIGFAPLGGTVVVADGILPRHRVWEGFLRSFGQRSIVTLDVELAVPQFLELGSEGAMVVVCTQAARELVALRAALLRLNPGDQRRVIVLAWPNQRDEVEGRAGHWRTLIRPAHREVLHETLKRIRRGDENKDSGVRVHVNAPPPQLGLRVLLAEDNRVNQKVAATFLERLGCAVDIAGDGMDAVRLSAANAYDVILMDCRMPNLDGYEATREIRARGGRWTELPIVALTADAMAEDQARCLAAGMTHHLSKPLDSRELERLLSSLGEPA